MTDSTSKYAKIEYDAANQWVCFTWLGYTPSKEYRQVIKEVLELVASKRSARMLLDGTRMGVVSAEDQAWLAQYWGEHGVKGGLRYVAMIIPKEALGKMTLNNMVKNADPTPQGPIEHRYYGSEEEAVAWLKSVK